jgi:hypothetical protein
LEEHNATESESICQEQNLDLRCISPRGQLWDDTHGECYPGCIDASKAELEMPYPELPNYPRDIDTLCTPDAYLALIDEMKQGNDNKFNLTNGCILYWSVTNATDAEGGTGTIADGVVWVPLS